MPQKMTEDELLTLIGQYERASLGSQVAAGATVTSTVAANQAMTTLEIDRFNAINAYFACPLGNEVENRSQIVLPEVRDTIEWIIPQLMRIFVAAKTVCRLAPENAQDTQQAQLETSVINHIFMQENNGLLLLHDFFKDALLLKNGYAEVYTEQQQQVGEESYTGLTEIEVTELLQEKPDEKLQVLEQREYPAQAFPGQPSGGSIFDIKLRRTAKVQKTCVTCLPPEEMRVTPRAREGMEDLAFAMHW